MLVLLFSYEAREREQFERVYGPDGDWAAFFRRGRGYVGTELLRDVDEAGRYLVVDRWESPDAYNEFVEANRAEFMARVDETRVYYDRELRLGTFENVW